LRARPSPPAGSSIAARPIIRSPAARILRIDARPVDCTPDGAIGLDALALALVAHDGAPLIVSLTCGTTVGGAHDDIGGVLARLDAAGIGRGGVSSMSTAR
jgi:hypothetical protein